MNKKEKELSACAEAENLNLETEEKSISTTENQQTEAENATKEETQESQKPTAKQSFIQFLKFLGFSCSAGVIQLGINALMYEVLHINYWVSYLTGLIASVVWNFTFNRKFTFKSANNIPLAMTLVIVYYVPFTILSTLWSNALEQQAGWEGMLVTAFTMVINFITEFLWDKFVVFRKPKNKQKTATEQVEATDTQEELATNSIEENTKIEN